MTLANKHEPQSTAEAHEIVIDFQGILSKSSEQTDYDLTMQTNTNMPGAMTLAWLIKINEMNSEFNNWVSFSTRKTERHSVGLRA